jgi:hypothetical protein
LRSVILLESLFLIDLAWSRVSPPKFLTVSTLAAPVVRAEPHRSAAASLHRLASDDSRPDSIPSSS